MMHVSQSPRPPTRFAVAPGNQPRVSLSEISLTWGANAIHPVVGRSSGWAPESSRSTWHGEGGRSQVSRSFQRRNGSRGSGYRKGEV